MGKPAYLRKTTPRKHPGGRPRELDRPGKYASLVETTYFLRLQGWSLRRIQDWLNANRRARGEKPWADPAKLHYRRAAEYVNRAQVLRERQRAMTTAALADVTQEELAEGVGRAKRYVAWSQATLRRLRKKLGRDPAPAEIVAALRLDDEPLGVSRGM